MSSSPKRVLLPQPPNDVGVAADGPVAGIERLADQAALRRSERAAREAEAAAVGRLKAPFDALVAGLAAERERLESELVQSSISLGLAVASELVRREIDGDRHDIEGIVRQCLAEANVGRQPMRLALHPDDAARLKEVRFSADVELTVDPQVRKGDALVTSSIGTLVRDVDESLANVGRALHAELRNEPDAPAEPLS